MILKETDSNTNKDISSAVSIGSYTATAVRTVMVRVLINQVAGNGDYVAYLTLTKSAVEYRIIPLTTAAAASGLTSIGFASIGIPVDVDDVLQVYVDGLAGDNSTPDTRVDWYEMDYLRPTVSGRTLDVAATGEAGLDFTNRLDTTGILPAVAAGAIGGLPLSKDASGRVEVASATDKNTLDSVITAIQGADGDTLKDLSDEIAGVGGSGAGTGTYTDTVTDGANPLDGVIVELSTDNAKANVVYQTRTNASGVFLFHPDPGTYYVWFELAGHNFDAENGAEVVVV